MTRCLKPSQTEARAAELAGGRTASAAARRRFLAQAAFDQAALPNAWSSGVSAMWLV